MNKGSEFSDTNVFYEFSDNLKKNIKVPIAMIF